MNHPPIVEAGVLILFAGILVCFTKPAIKWWRRRPWKIKGRPLRGATVFVGSITPQPSPPKPNGPGDGNQLRHYFLIDVTIRPLRRLSRIPWVPAALQVAPAQHGRADQPNHGQLDGFCRIESRELICGDISFQPDDTFMVSGKFDLQLYISVRHDVRILQFRYYLEQFGAFQLPSPISAVRLGDDLLVMQQSADAEKSVVMPGSPSTSNY